MSKQFKVNQPPAGTMKALILYDSFILAAKANAMLQQAAHHAGFPVEWKIWPWRLDTLKTAYMANEVLADSADAHLILFALVRNPSHPSWLQDWLEQWAARREIKDAALAMIGDSTAGPRMRSASPELASFAARHGLSLLFAEDTMTGSSSASLVSALHAGPTATRPFTSSFAEIPNQAPMRWGINE